MNKNSGKDAEKKELDRDAEAKTSLREAREALGISVDEVAHELRLAREVILSLDEGDYDRLGAPVFVRGHLRSYARLVGLSEEDVVEGYKSYEPEPEEFRTLSAHTIVKPGASLPSFILWAMLLLLLLVAAGYLLLGDDDRSKGSISEVDTQVEVFAERQLIEDTVEPVASLADEPKQKSESKPNADGSDTSSAISTPDRSAFEVRQEPVVSKEPEVIEQPVVIETKTASLKLSFSEECWVEVSDSKRRILYGLEKPNSEVEIQGTPPFRFFIGNIAAVKIELEGRPFTIPESGLRGNNTARFALAPDDF